MGGENVGAGRLVTIDLVAKNIVSTLDRLRKPVRKKFSIFLTFWVSWWGKSVGGAVGWWRDWLMASWWEAS